MYVNEKLEVSVTEMGYSCRHILLLFLFFIAVQCARDTIGKTSGLGKQSKKVKEKVIYRYINKHSKNKDIKPTNRRFQDATGLYRYGRPIYARPIYARPIYAGGGGGYAQPIYAGGGGYAQPIYAGGGGGYAQPGVCPSATCCEGVTGDCWCC
ncbi:hypothetical protein ZOSMA_101G00690 [Zostera marina]|uniref:Uncharacterized protein n=1 Tax=Zostera marina TaxID=29655 RepID=A0A0K9Q6G9_ZOSMR|nr:hypothetical protein ZOSMA_101G00690 [Zostera marina]